MPRFKSVKLQNNSPCMPSWCAQEHDITFLWENAENILIHGIPSPFNIGNKTSSTA
jgi:hypothetical protein